jgi:hypothetical protein
VVAHDQRIVRAEIADDALALVELHRRPLVVVIADVADVRDRLYSCGQGWTFSGKKSP